MYIRLLSIHTLICAQSKINRTQSVINTCPEKSTKIRARATIDTNSKNKQNFTVGFLFPAVQNGNKIWVATCGKTFLWWWWWWSRFEYEQDFKYVLLLNQYCWSMRLAYAGGQFSNVYLFALQRERERESVIVWRTCAFFARAKRSNVKIVLPDLHLCGKVFFFFIYFVDYMCEEEVRATTM